MDQQVAARAVDGVLSRLRATNNIDGRLVQLTNTTSLAAVRFPDGWIRLSGIDIPINRNVLAAHSPVFAAAFESEMRDAAIFPIEGYDMETVCFFLECFYGGWKPNQMMHAAVDLFTLAYYFQIPQLVNLIEEEFINRLTIDTLCEALRAAAVFQEYPHLTSSDRGKCYTRLLDACITLSIRCGSSLIGRLDWRELTDESHPMYVRIAPLLPRYLPSGGAHDFNFRPSSDLDDIMFITYHLLLEAPLASDNYQLDYRTRQLTARYHPDSLMSVAEVVDDEWVKVFHFVHDYLAEMDEATRIKHGMCILEEQYVLEKVISVCWSH